jgi:hypothetical protein
VIADSYLRNHHVADQKIHFFHWWLELFRKNEEFIFGIENSQFCGILKHTLIQLQDNAAENFLTSSGATHNSLFGYFVETTSSSAWFESQLYIFLHFMTQPPSGNTAGCAGQCLHHVWTSKWA